MRKYLLLAISLIFHLAAIGLIIYLTWPIAKWYLEKIPVRGVDIYLSGSYVSHFLKNFALPFNGWKDIWFSGVPTSRDYPFLYFYLMIPLVKQFGLISGIQIFAVVGLFMFAAFSYLLYHELSKNRILSVILTLASVFSANLYRSLVWAGGIPFWTTQAFYPIVIFLVVKYCLSENPRWFYLAVLTAGLGIMGHPQNFLNVILPSSSLILFVWRPKELKFSFKKRILDVLKFGSLVYLVALPVISAWLPLNNLAAAVQSLTNIVFAPLASKQTPSATGGAVNPQTLADVKAWTEAQFKLIWSDSNWLLWALLTSGFILFTISVLLRKKRARSIILLLPFGLIFGMTVGLVFLYSRGIDLYVTGWYKAFWPTLVGAGTLAAFLWGEAKTLFSEREFWQKRSMKVISWIGIGAVNLSFLVGGFYFLIPAKESLLKRFEEIDNFSSAYPEILNVKTSPNGLLKLKEDLKPKLMTDPPHDFRLYVIDATVNIAWGTIEDIPLTRGYVDPPLGFSERWGLFWLDSSLGPTEAGPKSSLIEDWKTPEEVADNNVRFLLDWYATKYLEGNHISATQSFLAKNITTDKFIEVEEKVETKGGIVNRYYPNEQWSDESIQWLNFYKVKEEIVSPILMTTNSSAVLHIGGEDGYDTLTRYLGMMNLGPRNLVLARGPKFIDDISLDDLTNFEALILYKYDYRSYDKAWRLMGRYVEKGGKVFIDTGAEVKESDTTKLPANFPAELPGILPIKRTIREELGQEWDPQPTEGSLTKGIDFFQFSPLVFDKGPWNISHPLADSDLREGVRVILRHQGVPVVAEKTSGGGKVIWSGFNLPYHVIRDFNPEEGKFFRNLLAELVTLEENPILSKGQWLSPRKRIVGVNGAKGVIFKEQAFDGWQADINGKNLKIYKTGPTSPGFMYVRLPKEANGQVKFTYIGALDAKIYSAISGSVILFILDYLLGGKILMPLIRRVVSPLQKRMSKWWEKEDEE